MKKFSFFLMGALAMAFAACEDAPETAPMQSNPQEPVLEGANVTVETTGALAQGMQVVDLEAVKNQPLIEVFKATSLANVPAGAVVSYKFYLAKDEALTNPEILDVTTENGISYLNVNDWNTAHVALFGKSPKVKTAYYAVAAYANLNGVSYRIGGSDYYVAKGTVNENCMDLGFTISEAYYLIGGQNDWALTQDGLDPYKFAHSSADVYDDPVFTLVVEVGADCYWKIVPQEAIASQDWDSLYGPAIDGDDSFDGMLVTGKDIVKAGKIVEAGKYRFTINMETMEYKIEPITRPEFVAVPSNANGWGQGGPHLLWSNKDDKPYFCGIAAVNNNDGGFKFIWDNNWYGGADGVIDAAGGNIPAPVDATTAYWFTVSTDDMTYTMQEVTSLGLVGGLNGWDNNAPVELTQSADNALIWSGDVDLTGEWKIIINKSWASNYGGAADALVFDGGNISGFEGSYNVTFDCTGNAPVLTLTQK